MFVNDRAIFLLYAVVPFVALGIIWCMQNKNRHKFLYMGLLFVTFVIAVAVKSEKMYHDFFGKPMPLSESWNGYGGASYLMWIDVKNLFDKGIPSFFHALMNQYNIPVKGGMIQLLSFFWILRILIVGLMVAVWILRLKDLAQLGVEHMNIIDSVSAVSITILTAINVLNGIAGLYDSINGLPINRYNELAWLLFVVLLIRWIDEKYRVIDICKIKNKMLTSNLALFMVFILLIAGYARPLHKKDFEKNCCRAEVEFLEENSENYFCGFAGYWTAYPLMATTNGKHIVCPGQIAKDEADSSILYVQMNNFNADTFSDGSNYFNYFIVDMETGSLFNRENIELIRGDYISLNMIQNHAIYLYDYDIRWDPRLIMEAVGVDYELTEPIVYYFDFPVGVNRIEMEVANSDNFELGIEPNMDIGDVKVQKLNDNRIYVDLTCRQNTSVAFHVGRVAEEYTTIHKIVLKRVRAAMETESEQIYLKEGSYIVTFEGDAINKADVTFEGEGISVKRLTKGRIKSRYQIDVNSAQFIKYKAVGKDVIVNKVYYENAILFDERVQDNSPYLWNL